MPVPYFTVTDSSDWLMTKTDKLCLTYKTGSGKFSASNLYISFLLNGKSVKWHPVMEDTLNPKVTTRTLDGTNGAKDVSLEPGILSRSGWALVDGSNRPLFDGSEWDWVTEREKDSHQDWYFFGFGHDYKQALYNFIIPESIEYEVSSDGINFTSVFKKDIPDSANPDVTDVFSYPLKYRCKISHISG